MPSWKMEPIETNIGKLSEEIVNLQDGLAIIVNGDTASVAVPVGGYAYIKNNTHGLSEGLYKNTSQSAFPASGGTADSTVFSSVSGALNTCETEITSINNSLNNVLTTGLSSANSNVSIDMQRTLTIGRFVVYNLVITVSAQIQSGVDIISGIKNHSGGYQGNPTVIATNNAGQFVHFSVSDGGKLTSPETISAGRWRMGFSYIFE